MNEEDESVLKRWSRRKAEAREGVLPEEEARSDAASAEPAEEPVDIEALPDPETMSAESDFSVFMRDGVPEDLRRVALRRLWRLDPVLANVDGLVDYGEDFTDAGTVIEGMKTAYRVGKGLLTDAEHADKKGPAQAEEENRTAAAEDQVAESDEAATENETVDEPAAGEPDEEQDENVDKA